MKVFIVLSAFVAVASASWLPHGAGPLVGAPLAVAPAAAITTGQSSQFRSEDNYGNYNFGYDESHATGATSRREEQVGGVRRGMYSLADADGRRRTVNYVADVTGFHADVQTNEPGVEPKDPADVSINKAAVAVAPAPVLAAPAPVYAPAPVAAPAPIYAPAPIAAPVAYAAAPAIIEAPAPRAFSYAFGSAHIAPAAAPLAAPLAAY